MTYQRIEGPSDLPQAGPLNSRAREKQDLDFKTFADKREMWEHAKDIAAFANSLGGVLLIGADDKSDRTVLKYPGVVRQTVAEVKDIYEDAGAMCSPPQNVDVVPIKGPGNVDLVAVNVDPHVDQLVASPGGHTKTGRLPHVWRFPIRRASQTDDIAPEDIAMYMNPQVRRAFLKLSAIPQDGRSRVNFYFPRIVNPLTGSIEARFDEFRIEGIPVGRNYVQVTCGGACCRIPLADVVDVWEQSDELWAVKVSGTLDLEDRSGAKHVTYSPRF